MVNYLKLNNWQEEKELKSLLDLKNPPRELYYYGRWNPEIFQKCTAVVGSRRMSNHGAAAVEKIIPVLIGRGRTIVSGFMYGIDQYAHKICLENGGRTIAVLGWGINTPFSQKDVKLAKKIIASGGILISEWEAMKPARWTFPVRNRIVAALADEVIVAEAEEKSGSVMTAEIALKLKRKLWAVSGPLTNPTSKGTNQLISSGKAQIWRE